MRMRMAVEQDVSLAMVSGRSGTGKTMLTQMLMNSLSRDRYELALVLINPGMSRTAMLRELALELRLDLPEKPCYAQDYLRMIQDYIIDLHLRNRKLVLVIDECQFLRAEALHTLRTLSNIETPEKKLLTCLLFAEPRFMKRLEHPNYESLRTRMYYHTELQPLDAEECRQYIKYRVLVAGGEDEMFDPLAYTAIHYCSGGVCRKINKVCALAMTEAYMDRVPIIDAQMIGRCGSML
jgi:general secretion pathway protein A